MIVTSTTQARSVPSQYFVFEMLLTEGFSSTSYSTLDLASVTTTLLQQYDVVLLPPFTLTASQASTFSSYVSGGGFLVGFRPDWRLSSTFGLTASSPNSYLCAQDDPSAKQPLCEAQIVAQSPSACASTPNGPGCSWCSGLVRLNPGFQPTEGLTGEQLYVHGQTARYSSPVLGVQVLATTDAGTPAVTYLEYSNGGRAALFAYDLAESVALTRQGDPWWGDAAHVQNGFNIMQPSHQFALIADTTTEDASGAYRWNGVWDDRQNPKREATQKNDIPQADEQMHLLSNILVWGSQLSTPLPRVWYYDNRRPAIIAMTGDNHFGPQGTPDWAAQIGSDFGTVPPSTNEASHYFMVDKGLSCAGMPGLPSPGQFDMGIHFDMCEPPYTFGNVTYSVATTAVTQQLNQYDACLTAAGYGAPHPVPSTTRDHCGIWVSQSPTSFVNDPVAHARILRDSTPVQLDQSFITFPGYGYMSGSGLPMSFLDYCGSSVSNLIVPVYELATEYEDDVQVDPNPAGYYQGWSTNAARLKYHATLSDALNQYHTIVDFNFHIDDWSAYGGPAAKAVMGFSTASGIPLWNARHILTEWTNRRNTTISSLSATATGLAFTVASQFDGATVMIPAVRRNKALASVTVKNAAGFLLTIPSRIEVVQGQSYGTVVLPTAGTYTVSATYDNAFAISGWLTGDTTGAAVEVAVTGGPDNIYRTFHARADGSYRVEGLRYSASGSYRVGPRHASTTASADGSFSPASSAVSANQTGDSTVNFTVTSPASGETRAGHHVFTRQVPQNPLDNNPATWTERFQLGTRFKTNVDGVVTSIRYWKDDYEPSDSRDVRLWTATGTLLAKASGTPSGSGWQTVALPASVPVKAGAEYVVAANTAGPPFFYPYAHSAFLNPVTNGSLLALGGVFGSDGDALPANQATTNFFRDVIFVPGSHTVLTDQAPAGEIAAGPDFELGMALKSDVAGQINAVRFFQAAGETGAHTGRVWDTSTNPATLLASVAFTGPPLAAGGWQEQPLATPLPVVEGKTYLVSVNTAGGKYKYTSSGFGAGIDNGRLHAPVNGGFYNTTPGSFPNQTFQSTNYYRDVVFSSSQSALVGPVSPTTYDDTILRELGTQFKSPSVAGWITAIRYWKISSDADATRVGKLWSPTGELLAAVTFSNETDVGWQEEPLPRPILINPGSVYTVSVNAANNSYPATSHYFDTAKTFRGLTATQGVFGAAGSFPTQTFNNNGFYRDVVFSPM